MTKEGGKRRVMAIASAMIVLTAGFAALATPGTGGRNPGLDVAATGISTQRDIDDPSGSAYYPMGPTPVTVVVKNTGDVSAPGFNVGLEVGKSQLPPAVKFYADAENANLPPGWTVANFTQGKWHQSNRTSFGGTHSAWCGPQGQAGSQYGTNWEEEMYTTNPISVPATNPALRFSHLYTSKFATDGGYLLIRDTANAPDAWDLAGPTTWSFIQGDYNTTTASINPISKDVRCFGGDSGGWQTIIISLSNYAGKSIQVKFIFSSSSTISGTLVGWFIDDVVVTDGLVVTFSENFESGMGRWTVNNLLGAVPTAWATLPDPSPMYNSSSTRCFSNMEPDVNNSYFDGEDSALVTPDIPLSDVTHARLHFWYKMKAQSSLDGGFVEARRGSGEWMYLKPFMRNYPSTIDSNSPYGGAGALNTTDPANEWVRATFDLSAFTGANAKLRFHFYANADGTVSRGWFIDDITVITWKFEPVASDVRSISALGVLKTDNATFNFNLSQEGFYSLKATTQLPSDTNPGNDMAYVIIEVRNVLTLEVLFDQMMPVTVLHGRKAEIGVTVWNTGNMINSIELRNSTPPSGFTVSYNRSVVNVTAGAKALVKMEVGVPLDHPNGLNIFSLNASSRLDPARFSEKRIEILVDNNAPTASVRAQAGGLVFTPIVFDATGSSDPDSDPLNYTWSFGDGTKGFGNVTSHSFAAAGKYNVTLNVSDGGPGSFSLAWTEMNISDKEPVAIFDIDTPINNGTYQKDSLVVFNATRSRDESPALLNFTWDFGDNSDYGYGMVVGHVFVSGGLFTVTLTVSDPGGQQNSNAKDVLINRPPSANISSPLDNQVFFIDDEILFSSNGSFDPDENALTFKWEDNLEPVRELSTSPFFSRNLTVIGRHIITLTVFDGKGPVSSSYDQVTIEITERTNVAPVLSGGKVDPGSGNEGTVFRYSVTYSDANGDVPDYIQVVIDGRTDSPNALSAADLSDTNFIDGKDYFYCTTALRGEDSPHSFVFVTADRHNSGRVSTESQVGPMVKWVRDLAKDTPDFSKLRGSVYQTGPYRTILTLTNNITPPDIPAGKLPLGLAFTMNITAPADRWYWANITIIYSAFDLTKINESTLRVYWSIDGGPWTPVPESGQEPGQLLWVNVTRPSAKFAVFGNPATTGPVGPGKNNATKPDDSLMYMGIAGVVAAAVVVLGAAAYLRRKPAVPPEPDLQRIEEVPAGPRPERKWAKAEGVARPEAMVGTTGEEVKVFRPAGGEVKVFRPGGEEKIFKPAQDEEEEKIFRPGAREVVEEEAREPPVVEEETPREKVIEYQEGAEEQQDSMPGARPAEEEVESSEESESEPKGPEAQGQSRGPSKEEPEAKQKKSDDETLDDLLEDLNK